MNWDRVEGNWKQFKGQAQQKWGKLTDDDLDVVKGKRTELSGRLQERYGYQKDQAEKLKNKLEKQGMGQDHAHQEALHRVVAEQGYSSGGGDSGKHANQEDNHRRGSEK